MSAAGYLVTLFAGITLAALLNPLSALVYALVWFDILVLARAAFAESVGFELLTLAAIISGISLGPTGGLIFSLVGIPLLAIILNAAVFRAFSPRIPNIDFAAMGIAAALAGSLVMSLPFFAAVFIAVILKHVITNVISLFMSGGINYASIINILFTYLVLILLKETGLLAVIA